MSSPCVIMDIDGTLANADHRVHLIRDVASGQKKTSPNWPAFLAAAEHDAPNPEIVFLNNLVCREVPVFIVTGRGREDEAMTIEWLKRHGVDYDKLFMRRVGDRRQDVEIKKEILDLIRSSGFEPLFAVEDRASVTAMWRENGVRCLQVCEGDY